MVHTNVDVFMFRNINIFNIFVVICISFFGSTLLAAPIDELSTIRKLPLIRIAITSAPGNGHQSAAATVYTRLRQLGFSGHIEIVYSLDAKEKLPYLIAPFDGTAGDIQVFPEQNVSFVTWKEFKDNAIKYPQVDLGIMGADDFNKTALDLRVKRFLKLQPFGWLISEGISAHKVEFVSEDGKLTSENHRELADLKYVLDLPTVEDVSSFLGTQMRTKQFNRVGDSLEKILSQKENFEISAIYGHHAADGQVLIYSEAIAMAFDKLSQPSPGRTPRRPTVIFLINDLGKTELQKIAEALKSSSVLNSRAFLLSASAQDFEEQLLQAKPDSVVVVYLGSIPKSVFEYIFSKATLPPIVEGRNSMNLMQLIGRPYLPSSPHEGYSLAETPLLAETAFAEISNMQSNQRFQNLIDFVVESLNRGSVISKFFDSLRPSKADSLNVDKLFQGLKLLDKKSAKFCSNLRIDSLKNSTEER